MAASSETFSKTLITGDSRCPRGNQPIKLSVEEMRQYIVKEKGNFIIKEIKITDEFTRTLDRNTIRFGNILHPFILPIIARAESLPTSSLKGISYLMYPYMKNRDLRVNIDHVNQGQFLSHQETNSRIWVRCTYQILQAVDFLHSPVKSSRGPIFHRNLTSRNIMLDENFNVRIGDFGIAVQAKWNATHDILTKTTGTLGYHPPNMNLYEYNTSHDVFSVGVVMLEILTGLEAHNERVPQNLYERYNWVGGYEHLIRDLDVRAKENKAARWEHIYHRDKFAEIALQAAALDENQRKTISLLQKLEDMRLEIRERYRMPKNLDRCVSCFINPTATLSTKGQICILNEQYNPCQYFCRVCLMNHHFNPLVCPKHGKTRPPFGDYVYGVFVAGNNVNPFMHDTIKAEIFMRDIQKVVKVITAKHPFVLGVSDMNVRVVMPEKPGTEGTMEAKIRQAFEDLNAAIIQAIQVENLDPEKERLPSSVFIFYFSGHCSTEEGLYLGSTRETLKASTHWIQEMLQKKLGVDQILIVLDCCDANSQNFTDTHGLNFEDGRKKASIVQLSSPSVFSAKVDGEGHVSCFTHYFCQGLLGLDSVSLENDTIVFCDECEKDRIDRNVIDFKLPCAMYHYQCLQNHGVTINAMTDFIQGHFQRLRSVTSGIEFMIQIHGAQRVFLAYYNPQKQFMNYTDDVIPEEIRQMGEKSIQLYKEALQNGEEKVYNIRVMLVGHERVGKTTLTKRLRGQQFDASTESTDGIDVHQHCFKISLETQEWIVEQKGSDQFCPQKRLAKLIPDQTERSEVSGKQEEQSKGRASPEDFDGDIDNNDNSVSAISGLDPKVDIPSTQLSEPVSVEAFYTCTTLESRSFPILDSKTYGTSRSEKPDPVMELCQLVNPDEDIQRNTVEYAALSMWDFAGQSAFYTTHQTFLTWRAVYLLVTDLYQQIVCKVHESVETWLNSIHSCARLPSLASPPVILVGTHADKIPEEGRKKVVDKLFGEIHNKLKDNRARGCIVGEIAVDNTLQSETELKQLKEMIFKVAANQKYWGEPRPAKWLILEQAIMKLRDEGKKVVTFSVVEELNQASSVKIETKDELNLFLKFQHELGLIVFFSEEGLDENIVLDPQWLIDAQKSLITAEQFMRRKPNSVYQKWCEFAENGKLTNELIDSIWTKEDYPEFHANKDHILLLMQRQSIIVKPKIYIESGDEDMNEEYFLAPFMLKEETPTDIISCKTGSDGESSSVFCCVFKEKFLPIPVFHKLVATCLKYWPNVIQNSKNLIFCNCCIFVLDKSHTLTLYFREHVIFAHVTRMEVEDMCKFSEKCIEAKTCIVENLKKIISKIGQGLQFDPYLRCPKSDKDSLDGLFAVSSLEKEEQLPCYDHAKNHMIVSQELLQFWFVKKKQAASRTMELRSGETFSRSQEQSQRLQESGVCQTTEIKYDTFSTKRQLEVCLTKNPRCGRIMVLTVEEMESYIQEEKIGYGAFGVVHKAKMSGSNFEFAIKEIRVKTEYQWKTYEKEIHSGRILHPFINPIIARAEKPPSKSEEGVSYLMYPYMQNKDLRQNIDREKTGIKLSKESNSKIWTRCIYQIAQAVDYLHKPVTSIRGAVFHRDLSSRNIFLDQDFNVKIGDFGVALEAKGNAQHATVTRTMGTEGYHPPNMNQYKYDASYDVFSVGVVMLEILTGEEAILVEDGSYLHEKYRNKGYEYLIDQLDQRVEEPENEAARWPHKKHRNKLAEIALRMVSSDETQRKMDNLLQELDDMRLDSGHRYRKPTSQDRCVSCYVNPPAMLSLKGVHCGNIESPCLYFCRHCLMTNDINPLVCPQHGKTRPPFGDHVYGVFVAGNNVEGMPQFSYEDEPSKIAQVFIRDVEKVVDVLTAKHPFVLGASTECLKVVKPNNPGTKEEMGKHIENAFEEISLMIKESKKNMIERKVQKNEQEGGGRLPDSLFIFYFSGHCSKDDGLYLGNAKETLKASTKWIKEMLHLKLCVDHVLVILDCCHADSQNFTDSQGLNSTTCSTKEEKVRIHQLSSCDTNQKSIIPCVGKDEGHCSLYTDIMCKGLQGLNSRTVGENAIFCCDKCEIQRGNEENMDMKLPCVKYHLRCDSDHAVTLTALKDFILGHFDLPVSDTDGTKYMSPTSSSQREKQLFLTYYNQDKLHISIHLKGIPECFMFSSLPGTIDGLKQDIIDHAVKQNVECDVLLFHQNYTQNSSQLIAIYPKYGRDKDEELTTLSCIYRAWRSNCELEARVRDTLKGLLNGPIKISMIKKSMITLHEASFNEDYLKISQNHLEMVIKCKKEAENQIKDFKKNASPTQLKEFRKFLLEILNVTQNIPSSILEKKHDKVLKFYFYDDFSVLNIE